MRDAASDTADLAAVALVHRLPTSHPVAATAVCSGALLGSNLVATAAHCVADAHGVDFDVIVGTEPDESGGFRAGVDTILIHPRYDPGTHAFDVALLRLSSDLAVPPFSVLPDATALLEEGASVRAVGFGVDGSEGDFPDLKRSGSMRVSQLDSDGFDTTPAPAMTCTGDSGGPVFAIDFQGAEQLVGLTVSGDPGCRGVAHNQRLDRLQADFVAPFAEQAPARDGLSGCDVGLPGRPQSAFALAGLLMVVLALRRSRLSRRAFRRSRHASPEHGVAQA